MAMTIGDLSRRTGVPVKALRKYEDMGLIYTAGRSPGNYRLFDEEALWCVGVIGSLRGLGLTLAEIRELSEIYLVRTEDPIGPRLAAVLLAARGRVRPDQRAAAASGEDRRLRGRPCGRTCRARRLPSPRSSDGQEPA